MARDGAILCHTMYCLLLDAHRPQKPSAISTCHLSVACDMRTYAVYLHWCKPCDESDERLEFRMQSVLDGMLKKERDVADSRLLIRNWVDWALRDRLNSIKEALRKKSMDSAVDSGITSGMTTSETQLRLPSPDITVPESEDTGEPSKKRRIGG